MTQSPQQQQQAPSSATLEQQHASLSGVTAATSTRHGAVTHSSVRGAPASDEFEGSHQKASEGVAAAKGGGTKKNGTTAAAAGGGDAVVTYTLWVGPNISESLSLTLKAQRNSSFYGVMSEAAQRDERFQFASSTWPNGHYIHTIHNLRELPGSHRYWLLYRLATLPDPMDPPSHHQLSPRGVDDLLVNDGDHFLFWYKKL